MGNPVGRPAALGLRAALVALAALASVTVLGLAGGASAEQAGSAARSFQAGLLDVDSTHSCAVLQSAALRCWGFANQGRLGYGNTENIGDNELPASAGPVNVGAGRTAKAVAAGTEHTCAVLDDGSVRCWGLGGFGQLGYANTDSIGDNEAPGSVGPVDLGPGRSARAVSAGEYSCALLDDGSVRCWGSDFSGQLGYGSPPNNVGDNETPGSQPPINLEGSATALSVGRNHACTILDNAAVRCWGRGDNGRLGNNNVNNRGENDDPSDDGPVNLGTGRTARAIAAGGAHTCAILDDGSVRCWGLGTDGRLGYGNTDSIGDNELPGTIGPVDLGTGRTAVAITAGGQHTCAVLDDGSVRCWGLGDNGRLGYGDTGTVGDNEAPGTVGPVNLGSGRSARAISAGDTHTCALLDDGSVRCWGAAGNGWLGYGNSDTIGDNESPGSVGPVSVGGPLFGAVADLSLAPSADSNVVVVGQQATLTLALQASGLDGAPGVTVAARVPPGLEVVGASSSQGTYDAALGTWNVGTVASGARATLTVMVRAAAEGTFTRLAEVGTSAAKDFDSTPGNGVEGEDDQASVTVTATAAPPPPPPPPPSRVRPRALTLSVSPRRDAILPLRFTTKGRLRLPAGVSACRGTVRLRFLRGRHSVASKSARLRRRAGRCRYVAKFRFANRKKIGTRTRRLRVKARFAGNSRLRPRASRTLTIRVR